MQSSQPYRILLGALALSVATIAQAQGTSTAGDPRGALVIVGGGPSDSTIQRRFIELAGGSANARILVLPMASALATTGPGSVAAWERLGAHAWSLPLGREDAMSPRAVAAIDSATGIWFPGGDQNRITRVLLGTPAAAAIARRYAAGAVVGGTSAGAAVMSGIMLTGDERRPGGDRRDTTQNWITIDRGNVVTADGLGLLPSAIVDQHFLRRRRTNRLISVILEHPALLGVGLDESTALVVEPGNRWSVIGASTATIFDARAASVTAPGATSLGTAGIVMHVLPSGSRFDPATGRATLPSSGGR